MIRALAHACFVVSDLEKSLAFYRDALDLQPAFDFTDDTGRRFGVYRKIGGRSFLELFEGVAAPPKDDASYRHICLEVDDIERTVNEIRDRGVEVTDPVLGSDASHQAWLTDPDGNRIELHAYTPESRQGPFLE